MKPTTEELDQLQFGRLLHKRPSMDIVKRLRQGVDPHEGIPETEQAMDKGADEIERLQKLLISRDEFICSKGLWQEFVNQLPREPTPASCQNK